MRACTRTRLLPPPSWAKAYYEVREQVKPPESASDCGIGGSLTWKVGSVYQVSGEVERESGGGWWEGSAKRGVRMFAHFHPTQPKARNPSYHSLAHS